jgi:hypothetical protein
MNPAETFVAEKKSSDSLLSPQQSQADGKSVSSSVSGVAKFAYTGSTFDTICVHIQKFDFVLTF